jgi:hypothetical protein
MGMPVASAVDGGAEVSRGEPEIALGGDGRGVRRDALARLGEQGEDVDLHRVVTQQHFIGDDLAQRQHVAAIMLRDVIGRAVSLIGFAGLRTDVDSARDEAVDRAHVGRLNFAHAHFAEIEQRHLQFDARAILGETGTAGLAHGLRVRAGVEKVDEARRVGQSI